MIRRFVIVVLVCSATLAQMTKLTGNVSYIASQSVYVRFESTTGINKNDTLFVEQAGKLHAALVAKFLSSRSVACEPVNSFKFSEGQSVVAFTRISTQQDTSVVAELESPVLPAAAESFRKSNFAEAAARALTGRISFQSSADVSSVPVYNSQRYRASFNLTVPRAGIDNLRFSNYMTFAVRNKEWNDVQNNPFKGLRIYDLGLTYAPDSQFVIYAGRQLHQKTANIGAVDGVIAERIAGNFSYGVVVGSRPDWSDYGFKLKLFQAGVFASHTIHTTGYDIETTLGVFNQTNNFKTDRRFIYIQHSNSLFPDANFFVSSEVDLYGLTNGAAGNKLSLTSIYGMARYTPFRAMSFSLSYDARKNVLYYETFKSAIETLIEHTVRQGIRLYAMLRPFGNLTAGCSYGYRFQKSDVKPSTDIGGNVTYSGVPLISGDISLYGTYLQSAFLKGYNADASYSRGIGEELFSSCGFRLFNSKYLSSSSDYLQKIFYGNLSYPLMNTLSLSFSFEGVFEKGGNAARFYLDLTKRF